MQLIVKITGLEENLRRLRAGAEAARRGSPKTEAAFRRVGLLELEAQRAEYVERSRGGEAGGFGWRKISPLTAILRRSGATRKLPGWAAAVALADVSPIMVNTGRLMQSLAAGAGGNVLEPDGRGVTLGTSVDYASRVSEGGASDEPAIADEAQADKVATGRFLKVLPGHKPELTHQRGERSRAKKNWNPEFFQIRGWLRKLAGRVFAVPARPILSEPTPERLEGYGEKVADAIAEDMK